MGIFDTLARLASTAEENPTVARELQEGGEDVLGMMGKEGQDLNQGFARNARESDLNEAFGTDQNAMKRSSPDVKSAEASGKVFEPYANDTSFENGAPVAGEDATQVTDLNNTPVGPTPLKREIGPSLADDYAQQAETLYPDAKPETKNAIAQHLRNNKGKYALAAGAAGLAGLNMMGKGNENAPEPAQAGSPKDPGTYQNFSGMGTPNNPDVNKFQRDDMQRQPAVVGPAVPLHKGASGVKPIAKEVKGTGPSDEAVNTLGTVDNLRKVQDDANQSAYVNAIGRAGASVAAGIAGVTPRDTSTFDKQIAASQNKVKNFEQLVEQEKSDPNSDISKNLRDFAKKFNVTLPSNMSAEGAGKVMPYLVKQYEQTEAAKARHEDLKYKYDELKTLQKIKDDDRLEANNGKTNVKTVADFQKFVKEMNPATASSRSPIGQSTIVLNKADRIDALIDQMMAQKNGGTTQQAAETARQLDSLLSGGLGTVSGSHDLLAKTGMGKLANMEQYVFNEPVGSDNQAFIKQLKDTVNRERNVAKKQQQQALSITAIGGANRFKDSEKTAEAYKKLMAKAGLDEDGNPLDDMTGQAPQTSGPSRNIPSPGATQMRGPQGTPDTMVSVMSPDGRKGKIPAANLQKALSQGYTQVQ